MIALLAAAVGALTTPTERWSCVYPGYPDGQPVAVNLELRGSELADADFSYSYKVVFDDGRALIGSYPAVGPTNGVYKINVRSIVIDRQTGDMIVANTDLGAKGDENEPSTGKCGRSAFP